MIKNVRKFLIAKSGLGVRIGVPTGLIGCCLSIRLTAQSLDAHSWRGLQPGCHGFQKKCASLSKEVFPGC